MKFFQVTASDDVHIWFSPFHVPDFTEDVIEKGEAFSYARCDDAGVLL